MSHNDAGPARARARKKFPRSEPVIDATSPPSATTRTGWLGPTLALGAMCGFAATAILAKFAYLAGANPLTLLVGRHVFVPVALAAYCAARRRKLWLPKSLRGRALFLGLVLAGNSIGYIGAVRYIPVSLAVLIFYTYPLIVALLSRLFDQKPLGAIKIGALLGAFAGLVLLLGALSGAALDGRGIALAALAAVTLGNVFFWSDRLLGQAQAGSANGARAIDPLAVKFHMLLGCGIGILLVFALFGAWVPPATRFGWMAACGFAVAYLLSFVALFSAIPLLGAVKASLLANIEPLVTVLLAAALLGERLKPVQLAGGALVIGAILVTQLADRRGPKSAPAPVD
jgi:drug/metabolite transporter (DMT)-like permease